MNILDLLILSFVIIGGIYGYRKGLLKTLIGMVGYAVSLVFSLIYYKEFGAFIDKLFGISDKLIPLLKTKIALPANVSAVQIKDLPVKEITSQINKFDMPSIFKDEMLVFLRELSQQTNNPQVQNLGDGIISLIATIAINGISIVLLCVFVERSFALLGSAIIKKKGFSFAEKLDKWVGAGIGSSTNIIMLTLLLIISTPILAFGQAAATPDSPILKVANLVNNSTLAQLIMDIVQGLGFTI